MATHDFLGRFSRRGFLRSAARTGIGVSAASMLRDLGFIGSASAQGGGSGDYKALICIFLAGGNDSDNTIVPVPDTDPGSLWQTYRNIRQDVGLTSGHVLSTTNSAFSDFRLHPALYSPQISTPGAPDYRAENKGIRQLFNDNKAAVLFNVGPLLAPLDSAQFKNGSVAVPPQLFSHYDQVVHWQTSLPDRPPNTGWAGRMADLLNNGGNTGFVPLNTSLAGTNILQTGDVTTQFHVTTGGAVVLGSLGGSYENWEGWHQGSRNVAEASLGSSSLQRKVYAGVLSDAMKNGPALNSALAATKPTGTYDGWAYPFPATSIGSQLKMVARMIAARGQLHTSRQTFFTQIGGFDTHAEQVSSAANSHLGTHAELLQQVSEAVYAFQCAMKQLEDLGGDNAGLQNKVLSFTASDFGRTFQGNGLGSDHGWGGHHFIFGGSGTTGSILNSSPYGELPYLSNTILTARDSGNGRWIPTTSVDQYCATLARWFGVSASDIGSVFPNLNRFGTDPLPFLNI